MLNISGIKKAIQFIGINFRKPLTLTEVARESGMSKYYFARTFKAVTGKTFKDYLNGKRVEQAMILLRSGEVNITEVCFQVGFNDPSYFDRVFGRIEGKSPSAYQKEQSRCKVDSLTNLPLPPSD